MRRAQRDRITTRTRLPRPDSTHIERLTAMLSYAVTFLIIALIAGILGFGVLAGTAMWIAKVCFIVFLVLFVISFITGRKGSGA